MLTTMRQIGNSRGVLIPTAFLASCHIEDQVDMQLKNGAIVLKPVKPVKKKLRQGWFTPKESADLEASKNPETSWDEVSPLLADDSEWIW